MVWALLLAYATIVVVALLLAERVIFQPPPASYTAASLPVIRVPVEGTDVVAVLHLPAAGARYTILFSHGNAEDLGHVQPVLAELRRAGAAVIAYDYRGYGLSTPGPPGVRSATADAEAVYDWAVGQGIDPATIVLHGRSVGSGPTLELAARREVAGVILESAFTSAYRVVTRVRLLPFDPFPNIVRVRGVRRPVLVIHGSRDEIIPFDHGRRLHAAAAGPSRLLRVEGAGHNDLMWVAGDDYRRAIADFLGGLEGPAASR